MLGLVAMPLIAQFAIVRDGWRAGWLALGAVVLIVGFLPVALFLVRRPEDIGLKPDLASAPPGPGATLFTTVALVMLAGISLMICYWLCRVVLDRQRLAAWGSAWARIGPRWTTRR